MLNTIEPCNCGGIPYPHKHISDDDYTLHTIRCMLCGKIESLEFTEAQALTIWNNNNSFKIDDNYLQSKLMSVLHMRKVRKQLNIKPILLDGVEQRDI